MSSQSPKFTNLEINQVVELKTIGLNHLQISEKTGFSLYRITAIVTFAIKNKLYKANYSKSVYMRKLKKQVKPVAKAKEKQVEVKIETETETEIQAEPEIKNTINRILRSDTKAVVTRSGFTLHSNENYFLFTNKIQYGR